jgi:hypothetical protein
MGVCVAYSRFAEPFCEARVVRLTTPAKRRRETTAPQTLIGRDLPRHGEWGRAIRGRGCVAGGGPGFGRVPLCPRNSLRG